MTRPIYINGRFLTQPLSGVQRYAFELTGALDRLVATMDGPRPQIEVLAPKGALHATAWQNIPVRKVGRFNGHAWEQVDLARHARGGTLVNLGGSGPLHHPQSLVAMHDAAIFAHPENFSWSYRRLHQYLRPRLARRAWRLVTVSNFSRGELAHHCRVSPSRFTVIGDSAEHILDLEGDPNVLGRNALEPRRYLLCVGNRTPNKNLALAARAFIAAALPNYKLVIVGSDRAGVFGSAEAIAGDGIVFTGRVTDGELRALYESAALFVFPSRYEGFGVPPLEAMTLGCPVLSSDAPVMKEVLGDAAAYFRNNNADSLTSQLRLAVARVEKNDWPIEAARAHARSYSWSRNAEALADLLQIRHGALAHAA